MSFLKDFINGPQLRMPKKRDSIGIAFDGPVLNGRVSVQEAHFKSKQQSDYPGIPVRDLPLPLPGKCK